MMLKGLNRLPIINQRYMNKVSINNAKEVEEEILETPQGIKFTYYIFWIIVLIVGTAIQNKFLWGIALVILALGVVNYLFPKKTEV